VTQEGEEEEGSIPTSPKVVIVLVGVSGTFMCQMGQQMRPCVPAPSASEKREEKRMHMLPVQVASRHPNGLDDVTEGKQARNASFIPQREGPLSRCECLCACSSQAEMGTWPVPMAGHMPMIAIVFTTRSGWLLRCSHPSTNGFLSHQKEEEEEEEEDHLLYP
jgi:hypothetical protein